MAKITVNFDGFDKYLEQFEKREKLLKATTEEALKATFDKIKPGAERAVQPHRVTGSTEESLFDSASVEWDGNVASVDVGFDLRKDVTSQFLIYGASASWVYGLPYRPPDMKLWSAIFGHAIQKDIAKTQEEIFARALI